MAEYQSEVLESGPIDEDHSFVIAVSQKKAPGIVEGLHAIAVIKDSEKSILELPAGVFMKLVSIATVYGMANAETPGKMRIAFNGVGVATRNHAHVHIILPKGADKLEPLVAR